MSEQAGKKPHEPRHRGWRSVPGKLALAVLAFSLSLVGAELALRVQEPRLQLLGHYNSLALIVTHPQWDHWPRPHASITLTANDRRKYPKSYVYASNNYGMRDERDLAMPKPPGVHRIFVLGDSFTEGYYPEDTVAAALQRRLDRAKRARYEVMNCGCSSYSPLLHYLRLKHQLAALAPDAVVMNVDHTDVYDDTCRYRPRCAFGPDGEPLAVSYHIGARRRALESALHRSYLVRLLYGVYSSAGQRSVDGGDASRIFACHNGTLAIGSADWEKEAAFCLDNIKRVIALCRERHIKLLVTIYPHRQHLEPDASGKRWHREFEHRVQKLCRQERTDFFSAFEGIAAAFAREDDPLYWRDDMHFTPAGQRVWGELIANHFARMHDVESGGS